MIQPPPPPPVKVKVKAKSNFKGLSSGITEFNRKTNLKRVDDALRGDAPELAAHPGYEIGDDEDKNLYYDTDQEIIEKVKKLADLVKNSKHMVAYTGAGISTSADLADYRSPDGIWQALATGQKPKKSASVWEIHPTIAHMALSELTKKEILKFTVTTNLDCLHIRSGIPPEKLSELHGNALKKACFTCKKYFFFIPEMDWIDTKINQVANQQCPECRKRLQNTNVPFGSNLPEDEFRKAKNASEPCDLALVLGTSMRVAPACNLPEKSYKNKGFLVICNLQKTPYDKYAALVIHGKTDQVMKLLMEELNIEIPTTCRNMQFAKSVSF